jgi:serine protease Do
MLLILSSVAFAQTSSIRDYVGVINQSYHPSIVDFFEDVKRRMENDGNAEAAKSIDRYLGGPFGTGFVYVDEKGDNYVITNNHVINQAYSLKFTLERNDGSKVMYEGLKVLAVDEDMDIAILVFANGVKPFTSSLSFYTEEIDEGTNVFSAGFPGLGSMPIYQFGAGIVSNRRTMLPVDEDGEEMIGPFIQHTAEVDPGNSGGPLLINQTGSAANYAIVGINTLKAMQRQSANYAIPAERALEFITKALGTDQGDQKAKLEERVNEFMKEIRVPRAVYEKIAVYLSNACVADNAEYALMELGQRGNRSVWNNFVNEFEYDPVSGLQLAVAWLIENSMREGSVSINISLENITAVNENQYTVNFNINDESVSSTWIREYGIWRISTFGTDVIGDKGIVERKEAERKAESELVTDYDVMLQIGLAIMPDMANKDIGLNASGKVFFYDFLNVGGDLTTNFDYTQIHVTGGLAFPIRLSSVAIIPFADAGLGVILVKPIPSVSNDPYDDFDPPSFVNDLGFGWGLKAGLVFTTKYVKGLYAYANYQYSSGNVSFSLDLDAEDRTFKNSIISVGIGYGF